MNAIQLIHSPGPWITEKANDGTIFVSTEVPYPAGHTICTIMPCDGGNNKANAALIAAAPALLRALKESVEIIENNTLFDGEAARSVIAKAEGIQS